MSLSVAPLRLLLANLSSRRIAGTEIYLEDLMAELTRQVIPVALLAESDEPRERASLALPAGVPILRSIEEAAAWGPTVAMVNGRIRADWESEIQDRWPSAYFIHNFYGTCISGFKRHQHPQPEPCFRKLGPACLALYLPRGCGGRNPFTMFRLYAQELSHQERLKKYPLLVTHSEAMRDEYLRHGFAPEQVTIIPFACLREETLDTKPEAVDWSSGPLRLLFAGRMEAIKGGAELIEAATRWSAQQDRPVELTMAGDGELRTAWQKLAAQCESRDAKLRILFPGWLNGESLETAFREHHLFVMPSLWPEPFGKGGMEAARFGCPSVGYRIGGIPQWLDDGVAGHLADWRGDAIANLAAALKKTFATPEHYLALRHGAREQARKFTSATHCAHLLPLLDKLASGKRQ